MDNSKKFSLMLDRAIKQNPVMFKNFDRTKNVQHQLQEMFEHDYLTGFIYDLWEFSREYLYEDNGNDLRFESMEQLWLAFVMRYGFYKQWVTSKQEWIKMQEVRNGI